VQARRRGRETAVTAHIESRTEFAGTIRDASARMPEIQVNPVTAGDDRRCLRKMAVFRLERIEGFPPARRIINVEREKPCDGAGGEPNICLGPPPPPVADAVRVGGSIREPVERSWVLAAVAPAVQMAAASSVHGRGVEREHRKSAERICDRKRSQVQRVTLVVWPIRSRQRVHVRYSAVVW
jgi:hypothetical protein